MRKLYLKSILLLAVLICLGCSTDDDAPIDPKNDILGKWEIIENSSGPISEPGTYEQYSQDSILYTYNGNNNFFYSKYWLNDSLLYKKHVHLDDITKDTLLIDIQSYRYELDLQIKPALLVKQRF